MNNLQIDYYARLQTLLEKFGDGEKYTPEMLKSLICEELQVLSHHRQVETLVQRALEVGLNPKDAQRVRALLMVVPKLDRSSLEEIMQKSEGKYNSEKYSDALKLVGALLRLRRLLDA